MPLISRLNNAPFKLNIYNLDKNAGLNLLKNFLRNLFLYDILILAALLKSSHYMNLTQPFFVVALFMLTGWNSASLFVFIPKLNAILHNQFTNEINEEKARLISSIDSNRFIKYEFLEKLKFDIFFNFDVLKKLTLGMLTFVISFVINYYDKEIMTFFKEYFKTFFKNSN